MSAKSKETKGKEETKTEAPQGFAAMCGQMMSGGMPDCCGPEMGEMMSQCMAAFQAKKEKQA